MNECNENRKLMNEKYNFRMKSKIIEYRIILAYKMIVWKDEREFSNSK